MPRSGDHASFAAPGKYPKRRVPEPSSSSASTPPSSSTEAATTGLAAALGACVARTFHFDSERWSSNTAEVRVRARVAVSSRCSRSLPRTRSIARSPSFSVSSTRTPLNSGLALRAASPNAGTTKGAECSTPVPQTPTRSPLARVHTVSSWVEHATARRSPLSPGASSFASRVRTGLGGAGSAVCVGAG
ncbi:MAG: hypothetical protein U0271_47795 [Polyangiaceae bacterium]